MTDLRAAAQQALEAKQVPLRELLASVPADARLVIHDADGKGTRSIPVGRLCHEAAAALAEPQEPDDPARRCGGPGCDGTCCQPVQEPMKLWPLAPLTGYYDVGGKRVWLEKDEPFPQPAPPQHKPLTEEEIVRIFETPELAGTRFQTPTLKAIAIARAIERAHKIGGEG